MNGILPIIAALAFGVVFLVLAARQRGERIRTTARVVALTPTVWFVAGGMTGFVGIANLAALDWGAKRLTSDEWVLVVALGCLTVLFATAGVVAVQVRKGRLQGPRG
jgi:hypothetical protein